MIFDKLDRRVRELKELRRREEIKDNSVQQKATDAKYRNLVNQVNPYMIALTYTIDQFRFSVSDTINTDLLSLFAMLQDAVKSGYADQNMVVHAETLFKSIQLNTKKEWTKHFRIFTETTTNTLRIISGIDSEKVSSCLVDIKAADNWTVDLKTLVKLKEALINAEALIQSLNLDQEVITFLTKMTGGQATLLDLNEGTWRWICQEHLELNIRLSFSSR